MQVYDISNCVDIINKIHVTFIVVVLWNGSLFGEQNRCVIHRDGTKKILRCVMWQRNRPRELFIINQCDCSAEKLRVRRLSSLQRPTLLCRECAFRVLKLPKGVRTFIIILDSRCLGRQRLVTIICGGRGCGRGAVMRRRV